jgi:hypothetical protein
MQVAERASAERGPVTDIYLPRWLAHNLPAIHLPLILLAGFLHERTRVYADEVNVPRPLRRHPVN